MVYIPQEAKEQIADLMSTVENLEADKVKLANDVKQANSEKESRKTALIILLGTIAVLVILLGYTYAYGPMFGSFKVNNSSSEQLSLKVKSLENENLEYISKIDSIKNLLNQNNAIESEVLPDLIYRVQIGAYKKFKMGMYSDGIAGMSEKNEDGLNKYSLGIFNNYNDASKFKKEVKLMGIDSAFIVSEYKGEKIDINRAIDLENN